MSYSQSDIVEFEFPLPNGQYKIHNQKPLLSFKLILTSTIFKYQIFA